MNEQQMPDLATENERLRSELATMQRERDGFRNAYLSRLEKEGPTFTQDDFDNGIPTGPWFKDFLDAIRNGDSDLERHIPFKIST